MTARLIAPLVALMMMSSATPTWAQTTGPSPVKAYFINEINVTDAAAYAEYVRQVPAVVEAFGGRYIVRAGAVTPTIGEAPTARIVVIEFPSHQAAADFWTSAEYRAILPIRQASSTSRAYIVDGVVP